LELEMFVSLILLLKRGVFGRRVRFVFWRGGKFVAGWMF